MFWLAVLLAGPLAGAEESEWKTVATEDLSAAEAGAPAEALFVVDGGWEVVEEAGEKYLQMPGSPIVEGGILFGPSTKGGSAVEARARGYRRGRSNPRFGVGVHGISGFRLRVVPARNLVELIRNEEEVVNAAYDWKPDAWLRLRLEVRQVGETWKVRGWVWPDGEERPEKPAIEHENAEAVGQGKASIWATPYSSRGIEFDDLRSEQPADAGS